MIYCLKSRSLTDCFSDGAALVGRFGFPVLGDFSLGVGGFAAFSAAFGLFTFADRAPDCGLFGLTCCSCSCTSLSFFCFHAFNDVGCT